MSFFDIFSNTTAEEKQLESVLVLKLSPLGIGKKEIRQTIAQCKQKSKTEGTDDLPQNFGDYILEQATNGIEVHKKFVEKAVSGGALEQDIRYWWNLSDLDRRMIKWEDDLFRIATYSNLKEQGFSENDAVNQLRKSFPIYGDPTDESNLLGQDRPLPQELHERVNDLVRIMTPELLKLNAEKCSSMNAFIRTDLK